MHVAVGSLVVARLLLYLLRPADLTPPYWAAMGATVTSWPAPTPSKWLMQWLSPADSCQGASVVFWAFDRGIPLLVAASMWKHVVHCVSAALRGNAERRVLLGMYGVGAYRSAWLPIYPSSKA